MNTIDPLFAEVTGPGSPFEIGEREGMRQFVGSPSDLNLLIEAARAHGEKCCIVEDERRLNYAEVFALRDALVPELKIERGDRVAICMRNRAEWMIAFLAVVRAGGVAALLNSRGSPAELVAMIDEVTPALVLADSERAKLIYSGGYVGRLIEADNFPAHGDELPPLTPAGEHDPCVILFTSGTTGHVKGAVLTHRNLITGLLLVQLSGAMILRSMARTYRTTPEALMEQMPQQGVLQVYPLFHISGLGSAFLSPFFAGSKIVVMRRWNASEALRIISAERITMFTGVPTMLWDLLNRADLEKADLSSLTNVASGGQALPVNLLEAIRTACPQAAMGTGYGMTECSGSVAQAVGADFVRRPSAAGRVLSLVEMKIDSPTGGAGEIVVRGPMVMQGYWNQPEATASVLSADGWLRTGDVGYVDAEGYVFIVDRTKDMVISGGENIYCAEVERALGELPGVRECAAFGIPDERLGELLVAVVVAEGLNEAQIVDEVGTRLARYKAPGRVAFSTESLPRNHVGKIDKRKLRESWNELIGATD